MGFLVIIAIITVIVVLVVRHNKAERKAETRKFLNDQAAGQAAAARAIQLQLLITGYCARHGFTVDHQLTDGMFGTNETYFTCGQVFRVNNVEFYLSMRGHLSRLGVGCASPDDIAGRIWDDVGLLTKVSDKGDIIAYRSGTPQEIIDQVLEICNTAAWSE